MPIVPILPGSEKPTLSTLSVTEKPAVRRSEGDVCGFLRCEGAYIGNTGGPAGVGNPPVGGASIAPGYTPGAFAEAKPRHPSAPKGEIGKRGER